MRIARIWGTQTVHNLWGIVNVLDITRWRPLPEGLLSAEHPLVTGLAPHDGRPIWPQNIVFATPRRPGVADEPDDAIVTRVGRHLARMVMLAVPDGKWPAGKPSRMPPAINYLHAGVHYPGAWLVFSTFAEAIRHFSDPAFVQELRRLVRVERREPVSVFRERAYDRDEFAAFVAFLRTQLPWFSNSNGPGRRVLWGNPSPYAAVNTITGNWMRTVRLIAAGRADEAVRPPIAPGAYFRGTYAGPRDRATWIERGLARATHARIAMRGAREGLFFIDKRMLDAGWRFVGRRFVPPWHVDRSDG
jgi:hypothetical protein